MSLFDKLKKKEMPIEKDNVEPETLIESYSPVCPIEAFVEQDAHTCYFYLRRFWDTPQATITACFICNCLDEAHVISLEDWKRDASGEAPMLPYHQVTHSRKGMRLEEDDLEIVWTMEGSGAGLLWKGELLAFIPEWAAHENFSGYSKYIKGETPFGWEMTQAKSHLEEVVCAGQTFWAKMEEDFWPDFQTSQINSLEAFMGQHKQYYAIDGGEFPPRALVTGEKDGVCYGITLGMSLLRQPMVESFYQEQTPDFARVELGFACTKEKEADFMPILQRMAGAASLPWRQITSLGHGHTFMLDAIEGFPAVWLINANLLVSAFGPIYESAFNERVNLLWLVPITQEEYDFLLGYDMTKLFGISLPKEMVVFDGIPKVPMEQLKELASQSAERNEINNEILKEQLAAKAIALLEERNDYHQIDSCTYEFGYLFDIEDHGLEALFKIKTDKEICYFAVQGNSLLRLNFNEELFESTTEGFLHLHQ